MSAPEVFEAWCMAWGADALHALSPARTLQRSVVRARGIENAGFEIRDRIAWLHTTGMPKSMDLSHAIDKHRSDHTAQTDNRNGVLGATRTVVPKGTR